MTQRHEIAPAKINFGLEILGKRADGFHEVRTILAKISLRDELTFEDGDAVADTITMRGGDSVDDADNLVLQTLLALRDAGAHIAPQRITIEKRIPTAAGLGGASSDAAATIRAFAAEIAQAHIDATHVAASLGSDVPFFLGSSVALASGRGELLTPLPAPLEGNWVVLAIPDLTTENKTPTMYRAVDPAWWSNGSSVQELADALPEPPRTAPFNVFERALMRLHPELQQFREHLVEARFPFAALSGAGPAFYTLVDSRQEASEVAEKLETIGIVRHVAQLADDCGVG